MKRWIAVAVVALLLTGGIYIGSPYWSSRSLKAAVIEGDADKIDTAVDFPKVREGLKSQLSVALMHKMNNDPKMHGNPFAGFGMMLIPTLVDRMVDAYVTPDGLAAVVRGRKPGESRADQTENPNVEYEYQWVSIDRFRVKLTNRETQQEGPSLLFQRSGFANWKLVKLELPQDLLDGETGSGPGSSQ